MDIVHDFPLDYMHLTCLGTFKRFMTILDKGFQRHDGEHVLNVEEKEEVNKSILEKKQRMPSEFHRKGQELVDLCRWKAVEFRTGFLYTGLVYLKKVLSETKFAHFLLFHVAMRLLLAPFPTREG